MIRNRNLALMFCLSCVVFAAFNVVAQGTDYEFREWKTSNGQHQTRAQFVGLAAQKVTLRKADGELVDVEIDMLHRDDLLYLIEIGSFDKPSAVLDIPTNGNAQPATNGENAEPVAKKGKKQDIGDFADSFYKKLRRDVGSDLQLLTSTQRVRSEEMLFEQLEALGCIEAEATVQNFENGSDLSLVSNLSDSDMFCSIVFSSVERQGRTMVRGPGILVSKEDRELASRVSRGEPIRVSFEVIEFGSDIVVADKYSDLDKVFVAEIKLTGKNARGNASDFEIEFVAVFKEIKVKRSKKRSRIRNR